MELNGRRFLVFYGKGGIGKTTVATNLAAGLNEISQKVWIIGCSPKSSLMDVYRGNSAEPILDLIRTRGLSEESIVKAVWKTQDGILLTEAGGPEPGIGCAGRGLTTALGSLQKYSSKIEGSAEVNYTIYDVIGDVVCGGFATPMRGKEPKEVFVVTSGELMSLYAANNIAKSVALIGEEGVMDVKLGGFIGNMRGVPHEKDILETFSQLVKVPILTCIPRDPATFKEAESKGGSVVQVLPDSPVAAIFRDLARSIAENPQRVVPSPIERYEDLFDMFMEYQKKVSVVPEQLESAFASKIPARVTVRPRPKRVSLYGTGGIGKSTVASNVSAGLVLLGERVYQIGCDPKRDSIANLCGELKPTVLDEIRRRGVSSLNLEMMKELIYEAKGYGGRLYGTECGGPMPGKGCAGKGVDMALKYVEDYKIFDEYQITFGLYDVLGDTVCGGFATPLKFAPLTYIVASGEMATMVQAMKIAQSVDAVGKRGVDVGIAGIINNMRGVPNEKEIVEEAFGAVGLPVIHHVPRSSTVQEAENLKKTVIFAFPESEQAKHFMELAEKIRDNEFTHPLKREILSKAEIQAIANRYA